MTENHIVEQETPALKNAKQKKRLIAAGTVGLLIAVFIAFTGYRYAVNHYQGEWSSPIFEKDIQKRMDKIFAGSSKLMDFDTADITGSYKAIMKVKNDKAVMELSITIDKEAYYKFFKTYMEKELEKNLSSLDGYDDVSNPEIKAHIEKAKAEAKERILTQEAFSNMIDGNLTEEAMDSKGDYDSSTGTLTVQAFKGSFNRLFGTFTVSSVNPAIDSHGLKKKKAIQISLKGHKLTFEMKKDKLAFEKKQPKRNSTD